MSLLHPPGLLQGLSDRELALYQHVSSLAGTIEDKSEQLEKSTIGDSYLQVHREYLALATAATGAAVKLESLKRLVFLSWYAMVEPDIYSGLNYYDRALERDAYALLETHLATIPLDSELSWMLSHYAVWWADDLLPAITGLPLPVISAFIAAQDPELYLVPKRQLPPGAMADRGQMGRYWQSLGVEAEGSPAPGE